jgi:hypothetical protein
MLVLPPFLEDSRFVKRWGETRTGTPDPGM